MRGELSLVVEDGSGVYVMTTLRFDFHMGSVLCVTCHGPERKSVGGAVKGRLLADL